MKSLLIIALSMAALHAALPSAPVPVSTSGTVTLMQSEGDKELAWVDEQIQAILPARVGISDGAIGSLGDPMKMKKAVAMPGSMLAPPKLGSMGIPAIVEEPLRLQAVMNKSALINGKWYKLSDNVRSYALAEIKSTSVLLSGKKDKKLILFLTKQNDKIKFTTK